MKKYFITGLLLLHFITLFGQECGTAGLDSASFYSQPWIGNNQYLFELKDSVETYMSDVAIETAYEGGINNEAIFWIPVKVWIYHTSSISGPTGAEIEEAIRNLNAQFAGTKNQTGMSHDHSRIQFYLKCDITYMNDPLGAFPEDDGNIHWRMNNNYERGAVNIHIVQSSPIVEDDPTWNGLAFLPKVYLIPGVKPFSFAIEAQHIDASTMAHEMGHVLGLLHTHEGTLFNERNEDVGSCNQEPVARWRLQPGICGGFSNKPKCEVNGDGLCDTDADPGLIKNGDLNVSDPILVNGFYTANYTGGGNDNWGDPWQPDVYNIMSYSWQGLREKFSNGQKGVMYSWILANDVAFGFRSTFPYLNMASPQSDVYEPDNFLSSTNPQINFGSIQHRSFHKVPNGKRNDEDLYYSLCDQDFVKFVVPHNGYKVNIYTAPVPNRPQVNTEIFLFGTNGTTILTSNDDISTGNQHSGIMEYALNAGTYWLKIVNKGSNSGEYLLHLERCAETCCYNDLIGAVSLVNSTTGAFNIGVRGNAAETDEFFGNSITIDGADFGCNTSMPLGFGGTEYGRAYSKLNLTICNEATINVVSGDFKVGNSSAFRTADVRFSENARLILGNNAKLIVDEGSRLIFDAGSVLEIQAGSSIELNGPNAVLIIRGDLTLGNNAIFSFIGNGFIRWEKGSMNPVIVAGTNAKLQLEGSSLSHKLMELSNNTVLDFPASLEFEIKNGKVFCSPGSGINISGKSTLFNSWFAGTGGATQPFNGVTVSSTQLNDIRFSYFDYANTGLNLIQTGNPNMPTLTGNRYRWCVTGLRVHDKGAIINGSHFIENGRGIELSATSARVNISGSNFQENTFGVLIVGTNPSPIQIVSSTFNWSGTHSDEIAISCESGNLEVRGNNIDGYRYGVMGSGYLRLACNTITGAEIAIEALPGATLNMANEARNNISNNGTGIGLYEAWLKIHNGKNKLDENTDRSIWGYIREDIYAKETLTHKTGAFDYYKYTFSNNLLNDPVMFPATTTGTSTGFLINYWPDVTTCYQEYLLDPNNPGQAIVSFSDNSSYNEPLFFECNPCNFDYQTCGEASPPWYTELYAELSVATNPTSLIISTPRFLNIELKDAIRQAMGHLTFEYNDPQHDLLALAELKDILTYNYGSDKENIEELLGYVRHAMTQGLANAYTNGLLPVEYGVNPLPLSDYAEAILNELDALIDQDPGNFNQIGYYSIEKAQVYRLAGHYQLALDELNTTNASYAPNRAYWLCICTQEWDFLQGNIDIDQFIENTSQCDGLFQARKRRMRSTAREGIYQKPNLTQLVLIPNPTDGPFKVSVPISTEKAQIEIYTPQGSIVKIMEVPASTSSVMVENLHLLPGTYLVKYKGAEKQLNGKLVVIK